MPPAVAAYTTPRDFPREELYALIGQIRRAAASIPANVAEGYGRETKKSYLQFLRMAYGSLKELETHLMLAESGDVLRTYDAGKLLTECERGSELRRNFIRAVQSKIVGEPD